LDPRRLHGWAYVIFSEYQQRIRKRNWPECRSSIKPFLIPFLISFFPAGKSHAKFPNYNKESRKAGKTKRQTSASPKQSASHALCDCLFRTQLRTRFPTTKPMIHHASQRTVGGHSKAANGLCSVLNRISEIINPPKHTPTATHRPKISGLIFMI
jgi:hypothetical protein